MKRFDWMLFGYAAWRAWQGRPHHFATILARTDQVLYVDPPLSMLRHRGVAARVEHANRNIRCLRLGAGLPGDRVAPVHAINHLRWRAEIRRAVRQTGLGTDRPLVGVIQLPIWDRLPAGVRADVWVYDCVDAFRYIPPNHPGHIDACERRLVQDVDLCVAVSKPLIERLAGFGRSARLLPNACDPAHFAEVPELAPHPAVADLPHPRMLFVGGLDLCVDLEALLAAARALPGGSLVLVGPPQTPAVAGRFSGLANVHLLGRRPYEEVPALMAGADLCLLPFRTTPWGICRDNIKLYEYLASGLPIAATDLPRAHDFCDLVEIAPAGEGPTGFATACRRALEGDNPGRREARRRAAAEHTWEHRVGSLRTMVEQSRRATVAGNA